jgi:uncharacterized protein YndB with AHSA1/START domain
MSEAADRQPANDAGDGDLVFEADLEAPPEKVWRAVATPELREAWLGEPEIGLAEVQRAEPPSRLDLVWPTAQGDTLVSFEIEPAEGGAHITITHRAMARVAQFRRRADGTQTACAWRMAA